jgi:hypothetical protein
MAMVMNLWTNRPTDIHHENSNTHTDNDNGDNVRLFREKHPLVLLSPYMSSWQNLTTLVTTQVGADPKNNRYYISEVNQNTWSAAAYLITRQRALSLLNNITTTGITRGDIGTEHFIIQQPGMYM